MVWMLACNPVQADAIHNYILFDRWEGNCTSVWQVNAKWQLCSFCAIENITNRGIVWSDEEVRDLIHNLGDDKIQQELDGTLRNKSICVASTKKMLEKGYNSTSMGCKMFSELELLIFPHWSLTTCFTSPLATAMAVEWTSFHSGPCGSGCYISLVLK